MDIQHARHYIAYHKISSWGEYGESDENGEFAHYSRHSLQKLEQTIHQNIWVVSGERLGGRWTNSMVFY